MDEVEEEGDGEESEDLHFSSTRVGKGGPRSCQTQSKKTQVNYHR